MFPARSHTATHRFFEALSSPHSAHPQYATQTTRSRVQPHRRSGQPKVYSSCTDTAGNGIAAHGVPQVKPTIGEADDVCITMTVGKDRSLDLQRLNEVSVHRAYHDMLHLDFAFDELLAEHVL